VVFCLTLFGPVSAGEQSRPNILLVVFEDMSAHIGAYGDPVAQTPVLDGFAGQSVVYENVFTAAGVCAPSRAALITGRYQQSFGAQHMRTVNGAALPDGRTVPYDAVPPPEVKAFPELLRAAGYYTTNNGKTDYQFGGHTGGPFTIWDDSAAEHPWRGRAEGQPFFAMVNIDETHESYVFRPEAVQPDAVFPGLMDRVTAFTGNRTPVTDPADVRVPAYLPDTPLVRADIARLYDNIHYAERQLDHLLAQLERDGLADDTIVIVTTDHGDGLPRAKRSLYDSGLHVPLMIRWPERAGAGSRNAELVSFVDVAPTILSWAGISLPEWMHGRVFAGEVRSPERGYVYAAMDRHDEVPDRIRAVRDERWKYMRNYQPDHAFFRPLAFRDNLVVMQELWRLHGEGKLTPAQQQYFTSSRPAEELYDTWADPDEVSNLAGSPSFAADLVRMRRAYERFHQRVLDLSEVTEAQMLAAMWPNYEQPQTKAPIARVANGNVVLQSATDGASIGYRIDGGAWRLYTSPFSVKASSRVEAKAVRYGYAESPAIVVAAGVQSR
jgi:arylsulfatase A-like enzyme